MATGNLKTSNFGLKTCITVTGLRQKLETYCSTVAHDD